MQSMVLYNLLALMLASTVFGQEASAEEEKRNNIVLAHGVLMGLAFAIFYPSGAIILKLFRFKGVVWLHAGWQIFANLVALSAFGLGVWLSVSSGYPLVNSNGHKVIGIIVMGVLFFQPFGGLIAHQVFKKKNQKNAFGIAHRWVGRVFLILGAINGGLGLQLAGNSKAGEIAYGVLSAFFFLLWLFVGLIRWVQEKKVKKDGLHGNGAKEFRSDSNTTAESLVGEKGSHE